jgi:hypothetical protein
VNTQAGDTGGGGKRPSRLESWFSRLPSWLRPLEEAPQRKGRRWRIETVVLLVLALVISVATVYDLTREVKVDNRLTADIETWRHVAEIPDEEVAVEQDLTSYSTRDTACADVIESKTRVSVRLCLMLDGPVSGNRRKVLGGFYLPPYLSLGPNDRYGCFGSTVGEHFCTYGPRPGLPGGVPKGFKRTG